MITVEIMINKEREFNKRFRWNVVLLDDFLIKSVELFVSCLIKNNIIKTQPIRHDKVRD